jgi:hypothetical protein
MIQRFLACGLALPQPTGMRLGKWSRRLGEEEKLDGRHDQAVSAKRLSKTLLLPQRGPRRGYGRTARIVSITSGWVRRDSRRHSLAV